MELRISAPCLGIKKVVRRARQFAPFLMIGAVKYGPLRAEVIILKYVKNRSGFEYF